MARMVEHRDGGNDMTRLPLISWAYDALEIVFGEEYMRRRYVRINPALRRVNNKSN